jgi:hypothetical protein
MKDINTYAVVDENGVCYSFHGREVDAIKATVETKACTIVKLTGQMPEPKKMKMVALFAYRSQMGDLAVSDYLRTEEEAKRTCKDNRHTLLQWPYGSVLEVEK